VMSRAIPLPISSTLHERLDREGRCGRQALGRVKERSAGRALAARLSFSLGSGR
jgi:hypothetical protein